MPIKFRCPCGRALKTPDGTAGRKAQCPACRRVLLIPSAAQEAGPDVAAAPHRAVPKGEAKARVLVADSDADALEVARQMLLEHGFEVVLVTDGEQAIEAARTCKPDLIVADVQLDKISGFQVCRQLRDPLNELNHECWQTPFIMTAQKIRGREKQYAISLGARAYLQKPYTPTQFCSRIERILGMGPPR